MRWMRSGLGAAGVMLGLLVPLGAAAVPVVNPPITFGTHFILGQDPYRISDGNMVNPGGNAPDVMTQDLNLPDMFGNRFIKLTDGTDYTVDNGTDGNKQYFPIYNEQATNPAFPMLGNFRITWNGTIGGVDWQQALPGFCQNGQPYDEGEYDTSEFDCDLMKTFTEEGEEVKLFWVVWDIRWVDGDDIDPINSPSVLGGFDIAQINALDPVGDPISGAMHAKDTDSMFLPGSADIEGGMGIKMSADADDAANDPTSLTALWHLSENPFNVHGDPGDRFWVGYDLFVYRVGEEVPEPGTTVLLLVGLAGLAGFGRRRSA